MTKISTYPEAFKAVISIPFQTKHWKVTGSHFVNIWESIKDIPNGLEYALKDIAGEVISLCFDLFWYIVLFVLVLFSPLSAILVLYSNRKKSRKRSK